MLILELLTTEEVNTSNHIKHLVIVYIQKTSKLASKLFMLNFIEWIVGKMQKKIAYIITLENI
jgi:hypothetical protein